MPKILIREGESLDEGVRRFKRQVNKAGIIQECRKREFYLKKNRRRLEKSKAARKKYR